MADSEVVIEEEEELREVEVRLNQVSAKIMVDMLMRSPRSRRWLPDQLWPSSTGSRYAQYAGLSNVELT